MEVEKVLLSYAFPTKVCNKRDLPGDPVIKTSPPRAGGVSLHSGWQAKIPHDSWPKN